MNNLSLIKRKIQKTERLHKAQLLATKKGEFSSYMRSTYMERIKQAKLDLSGEDS